MANIAMASAERLMEARQSWRVSHSTAEISVPAWAMPIHQMVLMMGKPQATGMFRPKAPTPTLST